MLTPNIAMARGLVSPFDSVGAVTEKRPSLGRRGGAASATFPFCVFARLVPMDLSKIPVGMNPPYDVNAIIEIPQGGEPVKYELDKDSGALFVDRFLHTAMFYPGNYGFIPHTLADDGDPMGIMVVGQ